MKKKNNNENSLINDLLPLLSSFQEIQKQAEALGIFIEERELLDCSCGLKEDVAFDGRLFTYHSSDPLYKDTGLFFERLDESTFRCPLCKTVMKAEFL